MSQTVKLNFESREATGKQFAKHLRNKGYVPAVFYGPDFNEGVKVMIKNSDIAPHINSGHWETIRFEGVLPDGESSLCIMRDAQKDMISDEILHVDFLQLVKGRKIAVNVPIVPENRESCTGVRSSGGVFEQVLFEIELYVLPMEIPDSITYDVQNLELGESVLLSSLTLPESAEHTYDPEETIFTVGYPRAEEEETDEEGLEEVEDEVEVEVIGKGGSSEEEEE